MDKIKVLIADAYSLFTDGLQQLFRIENDLECVAVVREAEEAVRLTQEHTPEIVLLDIAIPRMRGAETIKHIKTILPHTKVIILTHNTYGQCIIDAIRAGADGYLLKKSTFQHLVSAIRTVHGGGNVYDSDMSVHILSVRELESNETCPICELRQRELEVLKLAAEGMSYKEISDKLRISEHTVGSHFANIYRKLGVQSRTEAVLYGLKQHWYALEGENLEIRKEPPYLPDLDSESNTKG